MPKRELHIEELTQLFKKEQGETVTHQVILSFVENPQKFQVKTKPEQLELLLLMADHLKTCTECMEKIREKLKSE